MSKLGVPFGENSERGIAGQSTLDDQKLIPIYADPTTKRLYVDSATEVTPSTNLPKTFEDTSFVSGDSPVTLDLNTALSKNATQTSITNDGDGDFTFAVSYNGIDYGDDITLKKDETFNLPDISIHSIKLKWIANSSYRVSFI